MRKGLSLDGVELPSKEFENDRLSAAKSGEVGRSCGISSESRPRSKCRYFDPPRALENLGKAVDEMKTADDKYRVMVDAIPTLAWSSQADGSAEFFNARWHDYTGLSPQEARAWGWRVTIHPDDLEKSLKKWRALLSSGEPGELEARLRRGDGVFRWFLFRSEPVRDERGDPVMMMDTDLKRLWPAAGPRLSKGWIETISPLKVRFRRRFVRLRCASERARDRF